MGSASSTGVARDLAFLVSSLEGGGVQIATARLVREFVRTGRRVHLVAVKASGPVRSDIPPDCKLVDLKAGHARRALPALMRYLRAEKPAVLVSAQTHINVLAILARLLTGYPKRLVVCEHIALDAAVSNSRALLEKMRPVWIRLLYPFADAVVAVSEDSARSLRRMAGLRDKVVVIHNGLEIESIQRLAGQRPIHPWLDGADRGVILGADRLSPQKNFAMLVKAFARLPEAGTRLIILGEGPERDSLARLASELGVGERVDFPGFVKNPFPFFERCGVFVLSSRWEGFANVVIEAMACGARIVAADCPGGPADVFRAAGIGRLVRVDDVDGMAEAIRSSLEEKTDHAVIRARAAAYSIQHTSRHYLDLFERLSGDRPGIHPSASR